jgi:cytochrome c5
MNTLASPFLTLGLTLLLTASPGTAQALPDGPGQQEVTSLCSACHDMRPIQQSAGYSRADWRDLIRTVIQLPPDTEDRRHARVSTTCRC